MSSKDVNLSLRQVLTLQCIAKNKWVYVKCLSYNVLQITQCELTSSADPQYIAQCTSRSNADRQYIAKNTIWVYIKY